jgi:hypothetical protein
MFHLIWWESESSTFSHVETWYSHLPSIHIHIHRRTCKISISSSSSALNDIRRLKNIDPRNQSSSEQWQLAVAADIVGVFANTQILHLLQRCLHRSGSGL